MTVAYLPTAELEPEAGEKTYTSSEVMALTGITYKQLDYYCRSGRLSETAHGSGYSRRFTAGEIALVDAVLPVLRAGFMLDAAFVIARALVEQGRYDATIGDRCVLSVVRAGGDQ